MSLTNFMFKPKHGIEIAEKVIRCFVNDFLGWYNRGIEWDLRPMESHPGWYRLNAEPNYDGSLEGFTETCWYDSPLSGAMLTEDMMILLVEAGVAYTAQEPGDSGEPEYVLEDVELTEVITVLADDNTHFFSTWNNNAWVVNGKTGAVKRHDLTDHIFSLAGV